ncbi:uncharacterized protein LOC111307120 [Durio zibethinus]|uniref:Uncharacterized protein LOC111307120 n=1 Tax=Durio zibethinus TaxID=66656 RepID=A0A6P6A7I2_DURZI|nr:uncharacterized protein LOC111307120 [Durio zibethinus]
MAIEENEPVRKSWMMYFDGVANAFDHGVGAILISLSEHYYLITARDSKLISYHKYISELVKQFEVVQFEHLPREKNQIAGALAALATMIKVDANIKIQPIKLDVKDEATHYSGVKEAIDGKPWYHDLIDQVLLRCVSAAETKRIIKEVYDRVCGAHIYVDKIHAPPTAFHVLALPWLFSMWGMDIIGPITPKALNGHRFIFVMIDYFMKWVEAISYASVTRFVNKMMSEVCTQFKIHHHNSTSYHPKMNKAMEAANKNIKRILETMTNTYKDWYEKLLFALYAYRTSIQTSTEATLFSLVYGMEAMLPVKVKIPSLRVLIEVELEEAERVQNCYEQLNLIKEKRFITLCRGQSYQKRMLRAHDKKIHPCRFSEGDLVLKRIFPNQYDNREKWTPNRKGLYVVKKPFLVGH